MTAREVLRPPGTWMKPLLGLGPLHPLTPPLAVTTCMEVRTGFSHLSDLKIDSVLEKSYHQAHGLNLQESLWLSPSLIRIYRFRRAYKTVLTSGCTPASARSLGPTLTN